MRQLSFSNKHWKSQHRALQSTMSQHEVLLGELQMYSDSLREWGEKLREEDVCSKIMSVSENKDDMLKRYNMCKSLNLMEQEFQTQLMKHAGALLKLMNKLQDMVHCSQDLREVIEKAATPDILFCEKVKKPFPVQHDNSIHLGNEKPPAPKKLKKSMKKTIKLNTDCNIDESTIMPPNL